MSQEQDIVAFWDSAFSSQEPFEVKKQEITIDDELTKELVFLGQNSHQIIDVGCGLGDLLITLAVFNDGQNELLGLDASTTAIKIAEASAAKSQALHTHFQKGGIEILKKTPSASFDGAISSNFLDVIPLPLSHEFIKEITRILKKGGLFLLKVNFFIDPATLKDSRFVLSKEGVFLDGVLRSNNQLTETWIKCLSPDFELLRQNEFARLGPTSPKDRLFIFKKK